MSGWKIGDRVRNLTDCAHLYEGTPWAEKLAIPRDGTVVTVPWYAGHCGEGTLLVRWDSLTKQAGKPENWTRWMHSDHIEKIE